MESPERLSFISVAGMNRPERKDATHIADDLIEGTKNKMRTILRIGLRHGHDSLVLGAFGCGAYRNPPSHIATLFHEVFEEPEFKNKYRLISLPSSMITILIKSTIPVVTTSPLRMNLQKTRKVIRHQMY